MTSGNLIPTAVLKRKAVVYVRQSTQAQVQLNLEASVGSMSLSTSRGVGDSAK